MEKKILVLFFGSKNEIFLSFSLFQDFLLITLSPNV